MGVGSMGLGWGWVGGGMHCCVCCKVQERWCQRAGKGDGTIPCQNATDTVAGGRTAVPASTRAPLPPKHRRHHSCRQVKHSHSAWPAPPHPEPCAHAQVALEGVRQLALDDLQRRLHHKLLLEPQVLCCEVLPWRQVLLQQLQHAGARLAAKVAQQRGTGGVRGVVCFEGRLQQLQQAPQLRGGSCGGRGQGGRHGPGGSRLV